MPLLLDRLVEEQRSYRANQFGKPKRAVDACGLAWLRKVTCQPRGAEGDINLLLLARTSNRFQ
jgi:hypothetical protein